jgi:hypothetical protein
MGWDRGREDKMGRYRAGRRRWDSFSEDKMTQNCDNEGTVGSGQGQRVQGSRGHSVTGQWQKDTEWDGTETVQ